MPGPYGTAILDSFTRANSQTLGANWTADLSNFGLPSMEIVSNQCARGGDDFSSNWWSAQKFAATQEVFCTVRTLPDNFGQIRARMINPGTSNASGYTVGWGAADVADISTVIDTTVTTQIVSGSTTILTGHRVAAAFLGNTIELWVDTGGGWIKEGSATNTLYPGAGYLGVYNQNNTAFTLDDFGGGTISDLLLDDASLFPKAKLRPLVRVPY